MKRHFSFLLIITVFSLFPFGIFSQESQELTDVINEIPYPQSFIEEKTMHEMDWFLGFEPIFILTTVKAVLDTKVSRATYPFSVGLVFPADTKFSFQPKASFFSTYCFWDGKNTFPSVQDESTAIAYCFLMDFSGYYTYTLNDIHNFEGGTGPSINVRFAKKMNGLDYDDESASGTVKKEIREINKWFWKNANFLFWNFAIDYLYEFKNGIKAGPELRFYFPLGSVLSGSGVNGAMLSFGAKVRF